MSAAATGTVSYRLQCADGFAKTSYRAGQERFVVTLNGSEHVRPASVLARMVYHHPVYTPESVAAQARLPELDSSRVTFAGAYHGWGFHEDGCLSGFRAAQKLGGAW